MANHPVVIQLEPHTGSPPPSIVSRDGHSDSSASSTGVSMAPPSPPRAIWTHRLSASFSAVAEQISAASHAIAMIPPLPDTMYNDLATRLDEIQSTQDRLEGELNAIKTQLSQMTEGPEKFEKALQEQMEAFQLEQKRLPPRLHNALVTVSKVAIKPLPMANGKFPPQFPATRGEFEHLTKERYEALMKAYNIPISGDTNAKRETVRAFIGLPA